MQVGYGSENEELYCTTREPPSPAVVFLGTVHATVKHRIRDKSFQSLHSVAIPELMSRNHHQQNSQALVDALGE